MIITYKQWAEEIDCIKLEHGYDYLTKKRCRQQYGWDWKFKESYKLSANPFVVEVKFHKPEVESFYKLKWA